MANNATTAVLEQPITPTPNSETPEHQEEPLALVPAKRAKVAVEEAPVEEPQQKALPFQITRPKRADRWTKLLVYGTYGVGKTYFAASASEIPAMQDVLFIDAEAGDMSLMGFEDIDVVQVKTFKQFARIHEFLKLHCQLRDEGDVKKLRKLESQLRGEQVTDPRLYRTVVIDSLTEVQKMLMYQLLGIRVGEKALDVELDSPEFKEWGQSAEMIRLLVRSFRDLPMNTIFVCSEQIIEDDGKRQHKRPNLPGRLSLEVMGFMDIVGYLTMAPSKENANELVRRLHIAPGRTFQAKARFIGNQTPHLDNPTMADLLALGNTR